MTTEKKNLAASVHHRLHNYAKANGEDFNGSQAIGKNKAFIAQVIALLYRLALGK